jgi:hypothetical protein
MTIETERDNVLFQISHVLRTRCRDYLKIKGWVDDPVPGIVAHDILEPSFAARLALSVLH